MIAADLAFHKCLLTGTGNDFIAGFAPLIAPLLAVVFRIQRRTAPAAGAGALVSDHAAVVAAIARGDAEAARRAAAALIDGAEKDAMAGIGLPAAVGTGAAARSLSQ